MGDMADQLIDDGDLEWVDHLFGHPDIPADGCPYCEDELEEARLMTESEE